uniref:hypothetical protein n=1 Tax=uncultured Erythrobacter sp. TaxID=263913 RepID=UPI00263099A9|nr:hypothetical protein [uncultured Erythrobacter sp.]
MAITTKQALGAFLGATLAATPVAMANAEDAVTPANTNVAAAAVTPQVQFVDAQHRTINDARALAADASHDKVAIIIWGGNRALQQEAYFAARDLAGVGIPTAFVLAPDHNQLDGDAVMQVYAASAPRFDAHGGSDNARDVRPMMRDAGVEAYREAFPAQLAALRL